MLRIVNPATEDLLVELDADSSAWIARKAESARRAQVGWAATPLEDRIDVIARFCALVSREKPALARILTQEMGKPISHSENEISALPARVDYFLHEVGKCLEPETVWRDPEGRMEERIEQEPLGVIANISAWNYPWFVGSNVFIPALLTGNTVLYKPSEHATMTGLAIARLLHEAGVPEDAFIPVIGGGEVGQELLSQDVNGVFFTGSYATGKRIAESVAGRMTRLQLELGGKDPAYVCDDGDVGFAAESLADGAFYNAGQSCCAVERIYVHHRIHDEFVEAFLGVVRRLAVGDPLDPRTAVGPLARREQLDFLEDQIEDALRKGGVLLCGGKRLIRSGYFFEPTVIVNANSRMSLMREESFGPVIGIEAVRDDEDALARMRDTDFGLTASVYSRDQERARSILSRVGVGTAYWNCCDRVSPRLPWSGRGHSGIGSTLSRAGILAFLQPKAYHLRGGRP